MMSGDRLVRKGIGVLQGAAIGTALSSPVQRWVESLWPPSGRFAEPLSDAALLSGLFAGFAMMFIGGCFGQWLGPITGVPRRLLWTWAILGGLLWLGLEIAKIATIPVDMKYHASIYLYPERLPPLTRFVETLCSHWDADRVLLWLWLAGCLSLVVPSRRRRSP